jgi:hypothetical protein
MFHVTYAKFVQLEPRHVLGGTIPNGSMLYICFNHSEVNINSCTRLYSDKAAVCGRINVYLSNNLLLLQLTRTLKDRFRSKESTTHIHDTPLN